MTKESVICPIKGCNNIAIFFKKVFVDEVATGKDFLQVQCGGQQLKWQCNKQFAKHANYSFWQTECLSIGGT